MWARGSAKKKMSAAATALTMAAWCPAIHPSAEARSGFFMPRDWPTRADAAMARPKLGMNARASILNPGRTAEVAAEPSGTYLRTAKNMKREETLTMDMSPAGAAIRKMRLVQSQPGSWIRQDSPSGVFVTKMR